MLYNSMEELIGNTPLVALKKISSSANILAKLESRNISGSAKDRIALAMILDAEEKGLLKAGGTVIEPTSGNTGIGLCAVAAARGYRCIIVMPDTMSVERQKLVAAYGGEVVLTPGAEGMTGAIAKAQALTEEISGSVVAGQFTNPANPEAHYRTTGPEIWQDTEGKVDIFVAGIGTGGTISGVGRYLKEKNPHIRIVGIEPADSPLLSEGRSGSHKLQGIGANFVPDTLNRQILDEIITVTTEEAYAAARRLGREEGVLGGISSGAALYGAITLAQRPENAGKNIVVLLPDSGERYLSTDLY